MNETALKVKEAMLEKGWTLSTCESLTCGLTASMLGEVPGISKVYAGGLVTYMTHEKHVLAGVKEETLETYGAVDPHTAEEMALGTAERLGTDVSVSLTGNAGPDVMENKPAGLVFIGVCVHGQVTVKEYHFEGTRDEVRRKAAEAALSDVLNAIA